MPRRKLSKREIKLSTNSPGILSSKVGQPVTNCKRMFLNGFWSRNTSFITYQKSPKIRGRDVDKKQAFLEPYTEQHGNEVACMYCLLCCTTLKPRAAD